MQGAWVYSSGGGFDDIKSSVTVKSVAKSSVIFDVVFDQNYSGRLLRIDFAF